MLFLGVFHTYFNNDYFLKCAPNLLQEDKITVYNSNKSYLPKKEKGNVYLTLFSSIWMNFLG